MPNKSLFKCDLFDTCYNLHIAQKEVAIFMEIHDRLKAAREDADLTQAQAATAAGCARRQYIRYEQGEQEMGITKLKALCLTLGVSADYLLGLPRDLEWPR